MTAAHIPTQMRAWVLHGPEDIRIDERAVPGIGPSEVLVRVGSVGVCGSDKHFYQHGRASSDVVTEPVVLGHEFGGTIVAVGEAVDDSRIGERVAVEPLVPDWTSREARAGRYNIDPSQKFFGVPGLDGGLAEYVAVPQGNAHAIPDTVSDNAAAMVETISVALNGVEKAALPIGAQVLIAGAGPVGLFVAQLCHAAGAGRVGIVEPNSARREIAAKLGCEAFESLDDAFGDVHAFIECTGVETVRHDGFYKVRPGGRVVFIGVGGDDASVPMSQVIEREITLHGVMRYAFTWPTVIGMLANGNVDADSLVSRELNFDHAVEAWTDPDAGEIKTVIRVG
ncbi:alcohol dehydrogenase catalytic domain-containing protein [Gordonia hankookensis]|uniref:Alcohol dehydrogenase catalytic domain-containing protein n=1 Tax=Gordonia hankookensis TaxID=589403 RepID=A0ABR7WCV6_9ACTN|nr:alcohol dehydrogenase catalytic domain-containing protein [Gordonia hankookensis]MBD1320634.1 alcohol dehydrogenase catalytic domain-containing protein [Gordonia hankookensis]